MLQEAWKELAVRPGYSRPPCNFLTEPLVFHSSIIDQKEKRMTHQISPLTFSEFCLLLRTNQAELVLALLAEAPELQPVERIYLRAWPAAQQNHWEELALYLLKADDPAIDDYREKTQGLTLRRRRSWMCWVLGRLACRVGQHEDAFRWYTRCMQHLDERRMNDPYLRIRALCGRGTVLLHMNAFQASLREFEHALVICQKEDLRDPEVYAGLCKAHAALEQAELALPYGRTALRFTTDARQKNALRLLVGKLYAQLGETRAASALCLEAFEVARQEGEHDEAAQSLQLLAELDASQGQMSSARTLCEQAQLHAEEGSSGRRGSLSLLRGKLALAEEKQEEATRWYNRAIQIFAEPGAGPEAIASLAEAHCALARIYEASGHLEQASFHWKAAYQAVHPVPDEE